MKEIEINSITELATLVDIKIRDLKLDKKTKSNIKYMMLESFRLGSEVARNGKAKVRI